MRRNLFAVKWALLGVVCALWAAGAAWADTTSSASSGKKETVKPAKDPVAALFTIPHGTVLTDKQQKAYDKLKKQYESPMRQSMAMAQSSDKAQSAKGLKENRELRVKIKAGMKEVLGMPYADAQRAAAAAYQKSAAAYGQQRRTSGCPCGH